MEDARDYSAGLLTLDGKRKERMWIPESKRLELNEIFPGEERKIGEKPWLFWQTDMQLDSNSRPHVEKKICKDLFSDFDEVGHLVQSSYGKEKESTQWKHRVQMHMENWAPALRLRRVLLRSDTLGIVEGAENDLKSAITYAGIPADLAEKLTNNIPRRARLLRHYMFEKPESKDCKKALDMLLDLIASAKNRQQ